MQAPAGGSRRYGYACSSLSPACLESAGKERALISLHGYCEKRTRMAQLGRRLAGEKRSNVTVGQVSQSVGLSKST